VRLLFTKRNWKRLALGLAIAVAVVLIANGFMVWRTDARFQAKIAEIRAAGDPATFADLAPIPIPKDKNAAFLLDCIKPQLDQYNKSNFQFYETPLGKTFGIAEENDEPGTAEQLEAVRRIIDSYPEIDAGLLAAAAAPEYASQLDYSLEFEPFLDALLANAWPIRAASRFTEWRIKVLVNDEKRDDAVARGIAMLRLARYYESEPGLVSFLVSTAVRGISISAIYDALNAGPVTNKTHLALDRELAEADDPQRLVQVLKRERTVGIEGIERLSQRARMPWISQIAFWPAKFSFLNAMDFVGEQISLADRPYYELRGPLTPGDRDAGLWNIKVPESGYGAMDDMFLPALRAAHEANARDLADIRMLRIANALHLFRSEHAHDASGLADLSLPREATIDPFSGEPLKLKHTTDGWVIYSVAQNGVDDGGEFKDQKDIGLAPRRPPKEN
jgi:hypothetical protein